MKVTWSEERDRLARLRAYCLRELKTKETEALILKKDIEVLNVMVKHYTELIEKGD